MAAYQRWAALSAGIFKRYGCIEIIDGWEDFVPTGKKTDFFRAVAARANEKIVFSFQVWPDKEFFYASEARMHEDGALYTEVDPPFDASRLIFGCFNPIDV